jgi:uncharacterized protein (TIGR02001 family)
MKTYLTLSAIALAAAATLSSGAVMAADPAPAATPDFVVTGNFGITSDYRFRGISQSDRDAAFQGGFDVAHSSGLYVGTWASTVSDWTSGPSGSANMEVDLYGGYKTEVAGFGLDVGAIAYHYPGSKTANTGTDYRANTEEVYVGLSYGPATFKTSYVIGKNYFATTSSGEDASGTMYYDLTLSQEVMPKLVASVHAGYTDYKNKQTGDLYSSGKVSYADYNIGLAYDLGGGFTAGLKYYFNDAKAGTKSYANASSYNGKSNLYKDGFAVSLTKAF